MPKLILLNNFVILSTFVYSSGCYEDKCYKVFTPYPSPTWHESRSKCVEWGGNLASIESSQEKDYILQSLILSRGKNCWIGLNDIEEEAYSNGATFTWIDGSNGTYRYFASGQPNNGYNYWRRRENKDCVYISDSRYWNSYDCYSRLSCYICKKIGEFSLNQRSNVDFENVQISISGLSKLFTNLIKIAAPFNPRLARNVESENESTLKVN